MGFFVRVGAWAALALVFAASGLADPPVPAKTYEQWVTLAEAGDPTVDYTVLRASYVESPGYEPYGAGVRERFDELWPAFKAKDCAKVVAVSDAMLKIDYTLFSVHTIRAECFKIQGDAVRSEREEAVARGLFASLKSSGDGKTMKTAFVVVTMSEERLLLNYLGLKEERQSLLRGDGRMYDLIEGPNENTEGPKSALFDVTALFVGMARKFGGDKTTDPRK